MTTPVRPFVAVAITDHVRAARLAAQAAVQWGLPQPTMLRTGTNAVFTAGDTVLRVSRCSAPAPTLVAFADVLRAHGVSILRPVACTETDDGLAVIATPRVDPVGEVDWADVGRQLRRLHRIPRGDVATSGYPLPRADTLPHWQLRDLLEGLASDPTVGLADGDVAAVRAAIAEVDDWPILVAEEVVCHGDVHPGNVVATAAGPVLLDWDLACLGPREWDLAPMMRWEHRWGGAGGAAAALRSGYGTDVDEQLLDRLSSGRLLAATLMRVAAGRTDPAAREEAARRLRFWSGDPDAPQWRPA